MKHLVRTVMVAFLFVAPLAGFVATSPSDAPAPGSSGKIRNWSIDKAHTNVGFQVRHLGITNVSGSFSEYEATLQLDPQDLSTLQATAAVQVNSIDTGIERRDNHLRSEDFFHAEEYPQMTFKSTGVRNVQGSRFELLGDLTIRGTTKPVVFEAELLGPIAGPRGKERVGIEAETTIDRIAYGLKWDNLTEAGGVVVAHDVNIILQIEAISE